MLAIKDDGKSILIAPGNCIGETGFISSMPRKSNISAIKRSTVCVLKRIHYDTIIDSLEKQFSKIPLLNYLRPDDIPRLAPMTKILQFEAGENILKKKDKARQFYMILKGFKLD